MDVKNDFEQAKTKKNRTFEKRLAQITGQVFDDKYLENINKLVSERTTVLSYLRDDYHIQKVFKVVDPDSPPVFGLKICKGTPRGALIAFQYQNEIRVGWSKRYARIEVSENEIVNTLYDSAIRRDDENFFNALDNLFMYGAPLKEIEIPFSKKIARVIAADRAINDRIIFKNKTWISAESGPIPRIVAKSISRFLRRVEKVFGKQADNVIIV